MCTDCIWKGYLTLEGFMEEVASSIKPEALVTDTQMSRKWGKNSLQGKRHPWLVQRPRDENMCHRWGDPRH